VPEHYQWQAHTLTLRCHLQPKASRDEFAGLQAGRLKIRITAPPVDGKANSHLIRFLSKQFGVAKRDISITHGELSRQKTLVIQSPTKIPDNCDIQFTDSHNK